MYDDDDDDDAAATAAAAAAAGEPFEALTIEGEAVALPDGERVRGDCIPATNCD